MTRPAWLDVLAAEDVRAALRAAALDCMDLDECKPEECQHREQLLTPLEFYEWIEQELDLEARHWRRARREPAGRPGRRAPLEAAST